jgi:hypothetical protein
MSIPNIETVFRRLRERNAFVDLMTLTQGETLIENPKGCSQ